MNHLSHRFLLSILFLTLIAKMGWGQPVWQDFNGQRGRYTTCFSGTNNTLMAGTESGVMLSTNHGTSWQLSGLQNCLIKPILVVSDSVALANVWVDESGLSGLYRSSDRGQSWNLVRQVFEENIRSLCVADNGNIVLTSSGVFSPGIYYSTNQGLTWIASDFTNHLMYNLAVNHNNGLLFASCYDSIKIVKSTNNGVNWTSCPSFHFYQEPSGISITPRGTVIVDGYCRSTDNGLTWSITDSGLYDDLISHITTTPDTGNLFGITFNCQLVQSTDDGLHWNQVTSVHDSALYVYNDYAIYVYSDGQHLLTAGQITHESEDNGASWHNSCFAISDMNVYKVFFPADGSILTGLSSPQFYSSLSLKGAMTGQTVSFNPVINSGLLEIFAIHDSVLLGSVFGNILRSNNYGNTWFVEDTNWSAVKIEKASNGHVFAQAVHNWLPERVFTLIRSNDTGRTWTPVFDIGSFELPFEIIGTNIITWAFNEGVYLSTNDGNSWTLRHSFADSTCFGMTKDTSGNLFAYGLGGGTNGILKSTDLGATWTQSGSTTRNYVVSALTIDQRNSCFAIGYISDSTGVDSTSRIIYSLNDGVNWSEYSTVGLPLINRLHTLTTVTIDENGYVYVGTSEDGLYRSNTPYVDVNERAIQNFRIVTSPELHRNYPNPFNSTTKISFSLPHPSPVRLTIYDALGREVTTLLSEHAMVAGTHSVSWNATKYATGIYFCKMEAGNFTATKKLLLIK